MRKILITLLLTLTLVSCTDKKEEIPTYPYTPAYKVVDMSSYDGVSSTGHNFRLTLPSEIFKVIEEKSSCVFYLGRSDCGCCQRVCKYLNEVAKELDVYVYYIDAYNEEEPCTDEEMMERLYETLYPILDYQDGEKCLLTPHVFAIINGEFKGTLVCTGKLRFDSVPSEKQIEALKDEYRKILNPFVK